MQGHAARDDGTHGRLRICRGEAAVHAVAHQRQADVRGVDADLVRSPRLLQHAGEQNKLGSSTVGWAASEHLQPRRRTLALLKVHRAAHGVVRSHVRTDRRPHDRDVAGRTELRIRPGRGEREVLLAAQGPVPALLHDARRGLRLRAKYHAAGGLVQPVQQEGRFWPWCPTWPATLGCGGALGDRLLQGVADELVRQRLSHEPVNGC
mmetsp:Transcript_61281/g.200371  ORF Transcript_61281/g.200371 Transcript_61281/m.200371 type:complete len:207 (+) Transcript_61281:374-994(+)